MLKVSFRSFDREFRVHCADKMAASQLDFISVRPTIEGPGGEIVDLHVEPVHGFLKLRREDAVLMEGSASAILNRLYRLRAEALAEEISASAMILGASMAGEEGYTLVVGEKGSGKSTLSAYLGALGAAPSGDTVFRVSNSGGVPLPTRLLLGEGAVSLMPEWVQRIARAGPRLSLWNGGWCYAVAPDDLGSGWSIRPMPVRHLILLEGAHGGYAQIHPLDHDRALGLVLKHAVIPAQRTAIALAEIRALVLGAACWRLSNGALDGSRRLMENLGII